MTNQQAKDNYRKARSTMSQDDASCNYCGHVWEPTSDRDASLCPNCRRVPTKEYPNAPLGDVPIWRIKEADERAKKAAEAVKPVVNIGKPVAKKRRA